MAKNKFKYLITLSNDSGKFWTITRTSTKDIDTMKYDIELTGIYVESIEIV